MKLWVFWNLVRWPVLLDFFGLLNTMSLVWSRLDLRYIINPCFSTTNILVSPIILFWRELILVITLLTKIDRFYQGKNRCWNIQRRFLFLVNKLIDRISKDGKYFFSISEFFKSISRNGKQETIRFFKLVKGPVVTEVEVLKYYPFKFRSQRKGGFFGVGNGRVRAKMELHSIMWLFVWSDIEDSKWWNECTKPNLSLLHNEILCISNYLDDIFSKVRLCTKKLSSFENSLPNWKS